MRIYLDFDGVLHHYTDEYHAQMQSMHLCSKHGRDYFASAIGQQYKREISPRTNMFWMSHFFCYGPIVQTILENFEKDGHQFEIFVHSNWRGWGDDVIKMLMDECGLGKWFKGIVPLSFQHPSRLVNILQHIKEVPLNDQKWMAVDDYEDLFMPLQNTHFVKCESDVGLQVDSDAYHKFIYLIENAHGLD